MLPPKTVSVQSAVKPAIRGRKIGVKAMEQAEDRGRTKGDEKFLGEWPGKGEGIRSASRGVGCFFIGRPLAVVGI